MLLPGPRFTYEDYKLLPEDRRYEIIEGELLVTPAPNTRHQRILVEILFPSTVSRDQVIKRKLYSKYGAREYWVVDPATRSIQLLALGQAGLDTWRVFPTGSSLTSPLLPGLSLLVEDVFAE